MLPSKLIETVTAREWNRLETWAGEHVPAPVAREAVAGAFGDSYFRAASWWRTADGPFAMLLGSTDSCMRATSYSRHYFVAKNARVTCTLPDLHELLELAQTYAWLGAAARRLDWEYSTESTILAAIKAHGIGDPIERAVTGHRLEPAAGRRQLRHLLDFVDELAEEPHGGLADAGAVAFREYERSRRWLQRAAAVGRTRVVG